MRHSVNTAALRKTFSRIYIEEAALCYDKTARIFSFFPDVTPVKVRDYKHVFNRPGQNAALQKQAPALILAVKKPPYLYAGAPVCQSFGEAHFYYTSCAMNCPYDCEYCYLQGMYPSGDVVLYVNTEEIFDEVRKVLSKHPLYLCISFDTDLTALEPITGYLKDWAGLAAKEPELTLEVRTKCASHDLIASLPVLENMIFAYTLSPDSVIRAFEHRTPPLTKRLGAVQKAIRDGRQVRLCFDPMLYSPDFKEVYGAFFHDVFAAIPAESVRDASVGTFRIGADYLKRMRKVRPSEISCYPYTLIDGVYQYVPKENAMMLRFAKEQLLTYLPSDKLFFWEEMT